VAILQVKKLSQAHSTRQKGGYFVDIIATDNLTSEQIDFLVSQFSHEVGVELPPSYIQACKIVGCFWENELVGGFMLMTKGPFRGLQLLPDDVRRHNRLARRINESSLLEINGLWIKRNIRGTAVARGVWYKLREAILDSKTSQILIFYNGRIKGLDSLYKNLIGKNYIYSGQPQTSEGNAAAHDLVRVGVVNRFRLRVAPFFLRRHMRKRKAVQVSRPEFHVS
jgi:hypothetical protein